MSYLPVETIRRRRNGTEHTEEEIRQWVKSYTAGDVPDYQMSAWLMACFFNPPSIDETYFLMDEMKLSGDYLDFPENLSVVDKHSTGGVGDKASLVLGPIAAACGVHVPMITGRGLGHTGGTTDKLESVPGYNVQPSLGDFKETVLEHGLSIIGQTPTICPADRKIYGLRDVTATVESIPLICASILSKKLAEGLNGLVMDVKFGSGAFMEKYEDAKQLANNLVELGKRAGTQVVACLTDMNQPLGRYVGNSLEIHETVSILKQDKESDLFSDTTELSVELAALMIRLGNKASNIPEARTLAKEALNSGRAYALFEKMVKRHGGDLARLPKAKFRKEIKSPNDGYVSSFKSYDIGMTGILIGAGRKNMEDKIDPTAGFYLNKKNGEAVKKGETLITMFADSDSSFEEAEQRLLESIKISDSTPEKLPLVREQILGDLK